MPNKNQNRILIDRLAFLIENPVRTQSWSDVTSNFKMRYLTIILSLILLLCSYEKGNSQNKSNTKNNQAKAINDKRESNKTEAILTWEQLQDSLRNEILKRRENKVVKESFLQEMYIRNVVTVFQDSLHFHIPFNLHGPDCGAPDCYSTDLSFSFKFGKSIVFPEKIDFLEHEYGCIDEEISISGKFSLIEQTKSHIIYYSSQYQRGLLLFASNKYVGTTALYFTNIGQDELNINNIYSIMDFESKNFNEEKYPFTSFILTANEYEHFK